MSKPNYRVNLSYDSERTVFVARAPELEHCTADGASRGEAIARLEEEIDAQLANMASHGTPPPRPVDEETFSGEIQVKLSRLLHRDLVYQARSEGVDVDHLLGELLAAAIEARKTVRAPRGGNRHPQDQMPHDNIGNRHEGGPPARRQGNFVVGGGRAGYHAVMDDRANFIEYVRNLEQQGGHGPPRGGQGGDGGRRRRRGGHGQHRGPGPGPGFSAGGNGNVGRPERNLAPASGTPAGAPAANGGSGSAGAADAPGNAPASSTGRPVDGDS